MLIVTDAADDLPRVLELSGQDRLPLGPLSSARPTRPQLGRR